MTLSFRPILLFACYSIFLISVGCQSSSDQDQSSPVDASSLIGPGVLEDNQYVNEPLGISLPLLEGWDRGKHELVEQAFAQWNPKSGLDSLPSLFLLTTANTDTSTASIIQSNYFLQIETASAYPAFQNNPATYLAEVGKILTNAGQTITDSVRTVSLGNREVQRMDVSFLYGETVGRQVYHSWEKNGLFVNLVFTYQTEEEWESLSSSVLDPIQLN